MPLFDQPDLKASYKLHAVAPQSWKIITSTEVEYTSAWKDFVDGGYGSDYYRLLRTNFSASVPESNCYW